MTNQKIVALRTACIIPTYNGVKDLSSLMDSLQCQTVKPDIFIVDSNSSDGTGEFARSKTDHVVTIPSSQFNHGGTRQMMVDKYPGYDVYIFMTQDAYLEDSNSVELLLAYFRDEKVAAVCGRQLPHLDASLLAKHARYFNYPSASIIKSLDDSKYLGIKAAFMSNSFAAYRSKALSGVGGFPEHVIFAEDMYVAAKMLLNGWKVAYAGDACCRHSHNYTLIEEFQRYFDMGVFHAREPWIREQFGGAGGEGIRYVKSELRFLGFKQADLWLASILRNALKFFAYKLGQNEGVLPLGVKKKIGMYKGYWSSPFAENR